MYVIFFVTILSLIIVYLDSQGNLKGGLKYAFFLLGLISAIHYNYGNDYIDYFDGFQEYQHYSLSDVLSNTVQRNNEIGWALINWSLYQLFGVKGFFVLVAIIAVVENWAFYQLINRFVPRNLWYIGIAVYLLSVGQYVMFFSMMRQGIAVAIIVIGYIFYIQRKKVIPAVLMVLLASLFHGSAIIFIPFCFIGFFKLENSKVIVAVLAALFVLFLISREALDAFLGIFMANELVSNYADTYSNNNFVLSIGLGWLVKLIPFLVILGYLYNNTDKGPIRQLALIAAMSAMVIPFTQSLHMISRLQHYFSIFELVTIPCTFVAIKDKTVRNALLILLFIQRGYDYFIFFRSPGWAESYTYFHTVFEAL